jgi:tRNA A-37 threonylcarbamoyl transferase component Bud32
VPKPGLVQWKKELVRDFAMAIRQLHHKGVFHCDLKANNVMIKDIPDNERRYLSHQWEFYFIDLDRVRFRRRLPWRERIKNLAQLNAAMPAVMTRSDRLRFFRHYTYGEIKPHTAKERDIIQEIMAITIERHHIWPER